MSSAADGGAMSYQPGYIASKEPSLYGKPLPDFRQRIERIVAETVARIEEGAKLSDLLSFLAQRRQQLACDQQSPYAPLFGERRDSAAALKAEGGLFVTHLMRIYRDYGERLVARFSQQRARFVDPRLCTHVAAEQLSYEELLERQWVVPTRDEVNRSYRAYYFCEKSEEKERLFREFVAIYRKNILCPFVKRGGGCFFATLSMEREGKLFTLSQYLQQHDEDPLIIHHDFFRIAESLQMLESDFSACLGAGSLEALREQAALLSYILSHIMPFCRGSAAIREWLEAALYRLHGYQVRYLPARAIDLEALTTFSFREFFHNYNHALELSNCS